MALHPVRASSQAGTAGRVCCLVLARVLVFAAVLSPCVGSAAGAEKDPATAFGRLRTLSGAAYATAREAFLDLPGTERFLEIRVKTRAEDWLAYALLQRFAHAGPPRALRRVFYQQLVPRLADPYKERRSAFDARALDAGLFHKAMENTRFLLDPADAYFRTFDCNAAVALELEFLIRNPKEVSQIARFWLLTMAVFPSWSASAPARGKPFFERLVATLPRRRRQHVRADFRVIRSWVDALVSEEQPPAVRLAAALNLAGKESEKSITALARDDSALGALAALLYSARYGEAARHPFNALWLEAWARKATPAQLQAVERAFVTQINHTLRVPYAVAGLFLRHRYNDVSPAFKRVFRERMAGDLETVTSFLRDYPTYRGQTLAFVMPHYRSHVAWPKSYAAELAKIRPKSPQARAMIQKAIAAIRARAHEYPSGADLQAAYGPPPSRKDK